MDVFRRSAALWLAALCWACAGDPALDSPELQTALAGVGPVAIEEHMRVLAADEMEGRGTGTRGYLRAASYVAEQFEAAGLEAAGEDGGYYQSVPLATTTLDPRHSRVTLSSDETTRELVPDRDYVMRGDFIRERAEIIADLVWAGYGVTAPELDYDDYAGIDVRDKIVVLVAGAPPTFPHDQRAYYASSAVKRRNAIERGAVGVLSTLLPAKRQRAPWERSVAHSRMPSMRWIDGRGLPRDGFTELFVDLLLSAEGEAAILDGAAHQAEELFAAAEEGRVLSFELPPRMHVETASRHDRLDSPNVVARIRGSDPELSEEYVVLTAHLDHVGLAEPIDGDGIYNGAYDNASGVAVLLEVARALSALEPPPRRSLLFLALTGEERGLLGSDYFAHAPTVPIDAIVANVNLDMVMMQRPLEEVIAFGAPHSSLERVVRRASRHAGLRLVEDPIPEEVLFIRSDQYSFVRQGVPSLFLVPGFAAEAEGSEFLEWMRTTYHMPGDDMDQSIDFDAGVDFARVNLLIAWLAAEEDRRPVWDEDGFFGNRFGN